MQIYFIAGIVFECIILLVLALSKKLTRKFFAGIVIFVALCDAVLMGLLWSSVKSNDKTDQRESLYIAAKLLQDNYKEEALEALSAVIDEQCLEYQVQTVRGLALNENGYYSTALLYLEDNDNEMAHRVYDSSQKKTGVDQEDKKQIIQTTLSLLEISDKEEEIWDAKIQLLYKNPDFDKLEEDTDVLTYVKAALLSNEYEKAYRAMMDAASRGSLHEQIIVSDMYVRNYNLRTISEEDAEYDTIWENLTEQQALLNKVSAQLQEERSSKTAVNTDVESTTLEKEYAKVYADYMLARQDMNNESVGRALNYLEASKPANYKTNIAYQLQTCKLYYQSMQEDKATECLDKIFAVDQIDQEQWLGTDAYLLREAYLLYLSDSGNTEYRDLICQMMKHLYCGVFEDEDYDAFSNFVAEYLHELFSGIAIVNINMDEYPQMIVDISATKNEIILEHDNLMISDTEQMISDFQIQEESIRTLSMCFALDKSGSMSGKSIENAKKAIQDSTASLGDHVKVSLVSFESDADIECELTNSKYFILDRMKNIKASGGTDIVAGLEKAYDTLKLADGKKVIVLLSDGFASEDGLADMLDRLKSAEIAVYVIGLQGCDEAYLQRIADATEGKYISVDNTNDLSTIYDEIQRSLTDIYRITYKNTDIEQEERYFEIHYKNSFTQAKKKYASVKQNEDEKNVNFNQEEQKANYFRQIGGFMKGEER